MVNLGYVVNVIENAGERRDALRQAGHGYGRDLPRFLDTRQVAEMLGMSPRTLEYCRCAGKGPPYYKLGGGVLYALSDVERWVRARRRNSTRGGERAGPRRETPTQGVNNVSPRAECWP